MSTQTTPEEPHFRCRHIFTDGHRCGSPCLRKENFCFYHHTARKPAPPQKRSTAPRSGRAFDLPLPEDRAAIQASLGEVLRRLAANDLDPRRAGLILYGLQIASTNLPRTLPIPAPGHSAETTVEDVVHDPAHGLIAPTAQLQAPQSKADSTIQRLIDDWDRHKEQAAEPHHLAPGPAVLPTLQAACTNKLSQGANLPCPPQRGPAAFRRKHSQDLRFAFRSSQLKLRRPSPDTPLTALPPRPAPFPPPAEPQSPAAAQPQAGTSCTR